MNTVAVTKDRFEDTVTRPGITLIDWWATWCGPCRMFAPVFQAASEKHPDITFGKIDTEDQGGLSAAAHITSIPTLMAFRDGILVFSQPGALPAASLEKVIQAVRGWILTRSATRWPRQRGEPVSYGTSVTVRTPFAETVTRVGEVLAGQWFGVLTEINLTETLRQKLDEQMEDYVILGACSPPFAHQALGIDRSIGLCCHATFVVRAVGDGTVVEALDPQVMVTLTGLPELKPMTDEVARRLASALAEFTPEDTGG